MPSLSDRIAAATAAAIRDRPESAGLRELEAEAAWIVARARSAAHAARKRPSVRCECCNAPASTTRGRLCELCRDDLQHEGT